MDTNAQQRLVVSGPELRAEREDAGLTQEQIAPLIGVDRSTVSDYERRAFVKPRLARLYREAVAKLTEGAA